MKWQSYNAILGPSGSKGVSFTCFADQRHVECVFQANFIPADTRFALESLEIQLTTSEQHRYISANNNWERQCTHELCMAECNLGGSVMCLPQLILSFWRRGPPITVCTVNTALCFTRDFFNVTSVMIVANLKKHNWREQIEETLH